MSDSSELPPKCRECAKSETSKTHSDCDVCRELEFREAILCDLNRCIQGEADFQYHAFRQGLRLVGAPEKEMLGHDKGSAVAVKRGFSKEVFNSDKVKYERALALQKLSRDPDTVIVQLKYHFVWNVSHRMRVFIPANDFISFVHDAFLGCSEPAGGFVHLVYLAPDHVHVYVESDGERSVEDTVSDIKKVSAKTVLERFPSLQDMLGEGVGLWDDAYFVETMG
jgi:REP element-mobilizing transposase RayT